MHACEHTRTQTHTYVLLNLSYTPDYFPNMPQEAMNCQKLPSVRWSTAFFKILVT